MEENKQKIEIQGFKLFSIKSVSFSWWLSAAKTCVEDAMKRLLPDAVVETINSKSIKVTSSPNKQLFFGHTAEWVGLIGMNVPILATNETNFMLIRGFSVDTGLLIPESVHIEE